MDGFGRLGVNRVKKFSETQMKKTLQTSSTFTSWYRATRNEQNSDYSHPLVRNANARSRQEGIKPRIILLYFFLPWSCTPYSKMTAIQLSFYIYVYKPCLPRLHLQNCLITVQWIDNYSALGGHCFEGSQSNCKNEHTQPIRKGWFGPVSHWNIRVSVVNKPISHFKNRCFSRKTEGETGNHKP